MACCIVWVIARLSFGTTSIKHFLAHFFLTHSDTNIAIFAGDNTLYFSAKNAEDVIESLKQASVSLFRWFDKCR